MPQHEKFICISYSSIDFLISNSEVGSAISMPDFTPEIAGTDTGIFNLDDYAAAFNQSGKDTSSYTMFILKGNNMEHLSFVTSCECNIITIPLKDFSLFSDTYAEGLKKSGILACNFTENRNRYFIDIKKILELKIINNSNRGQL